jgi:hypothetical protein
MAGAAGGGVCTAGQVICQGFSAKVCDGKGGFTSEMQCPSGCFPGLGCVACAPGTGKCDGSTATRCSPDGSTLIEEDCDATLGLTCDPSNFSCVGPCAPGLLGSSYIGCEYWPTTVANEVWSNFDFAVAVANPEGNMPATITVTRGGATVKTAVVQPGSLEIVTLPWVPELKGPDFDSFTQVAPEGPTRFVGAGAYRLRSTAPVTVYQFNALEYTLTSDNPNYASCPGLQSVGCNSYSNDASLLLPTNALTGNYRAATYPAWDQASLPAYVAITATRDNTSVTFTSSTNTQAGGPLGALGPGQQGSFMMNAGDVIEIMSNPTGADVSGSLVAADKPVQVIAGVPCRFIPDGTPACDHIEESMLPLETLGAEYVISAPTTPGGNRSYEVRLHGLNDPSTVTIDPPGPQGATVSLAPGQAVSLGVLAGDLHLTGTARFAVSQYMIGGMSAGAGDPSQSNGVPVAQYRSNYTFLAPNDYDSNFVNITAPKGVAVTLDGAPVDPGMFAAVGGSSWTVARVPLSKTQAHKVNATNGQVGIIVYGYGQYTSYMYPGGLNLSKL